MKTNTSTLELLTEELRAQAAIVGLKATARKASLQPGSVHRFISGAATPMIPTVSRVARALGYEFKMIKVRREPRDRKARKQRPSHARSTTAVAPTK